MEDEVTAYGKNLSELQEREKIEKNTQPGYNNNSHLYRSICYDEKLIFSVSSHLGGAHFNGSLHEGDLLLICVGCRAAPG